MIRWGVFGAVLGAAALLSLTGCDVHVAGSAADDPADTGPINIAHFGHANTLDPCSFVDVNTLPAALSASLAPADALDDCAVSVRLSNGTTANVDVGPLQNKNQNTDTALKPIAELQRGMTLYTQTSSTPGFCSDFLGFGNSTGLLVDANPTDPSSTVNTCPAADALAKNAAAQIAQGALKHLSYPAGSVGLVDPCSLVPASTLSAVGLPGAPFSEFPEMHECLWQPVQSGSTVDTMFLEFLVGGTPSVVDSTTDTTAQIEDRATIDSRLMESATSAWCYVNTGLNTFGAPTDDLVEVASIQVHTTDGDTTHACDVGNAVAAAVWPQLPRTG